MERRKEYLELLLKLLRPTEDDYRGRINAHDKTWEEWLERTGELPPDFAAMPASGILPDPLSYVGPDGAVRIRKPGEWFERRNEIKEGFQQWVFGRMPPPPGNVVGSTLRIRKEGDLTVENVRLNFGPRGEGTLEVELVIPPGPGPFPVFMTNHPRRRPWVNTAARRGYMGCIYYALDAYYGTTDDSDAWIDLYPDYDFSAVARWAWGAMRALDFLHQLPFVDRDRIAIGGHSRNSKQALLAAAFDERIGAVVASRGNTGDQVPWRFASDIYISESLEEITLLPHWFHPRLRFFVGREHQLPVDQNLLLSLVAPRGLLISHGYMEHQGNPLAAEQAYRSAKTVYELLGRGERLGLYQQPGEHPSSVEDVESYFDFFDQVFGLKEGLTPEIWVHGYTFDGWKAVSGERIDPSRFESRTVGAFVGRLGGASSSGGALGSEEALASHRRRVESGIRWLLGDEPPGLPLPQRSESRGRETINTGWRGQLFDRPFKIGGTIGGRSVAFGDDLEGEIYYPVPPDSERENRWAPDTLHPLAIWLHPYSYSMGYSRYQYWGPLVNQGFAVFAFDQIGFGVRSDTARHFYERYPNWSLLGKMITDTRAAISAAADLSFIDPERIFLVGYSLGGKVAIHTAALDERVSGVSLGCAFSPFRSMRPDDGTEGLRHYSHIHGLSPRLGFFEGSADRVPIDYDEILASIAPRPMQVVAPQFDRYNPVENVRAAMAAVREVYSGQGAEEALSVEYPADFNRYDGVWRSQLAWLAEAAGLSTE